MQVLLYLQITFHFKLKYKRFAYYNAKRQIGTSKLYRLYIIRRKQKQKSKIVKRIHQIQTYIMFSVILAISAAAVSRLD